MSIIYPFFLGGTGGATEFVDIRTSVSILFDNFDARFFGELGLPDLQGWSTSVNGTSTITKFNDNIFGKEKDSIKFDVTGGIGNSLSADKSLTAEQWTYMLIHGASYSCTMRFESTTGNSMFSGMGFKEASNPVVSIHNGRMGVFIDASATHIEITLEGQTTVTLDGTGDIPDVPINTFFTWEAVLKPSPDAGVSFGGVDLYVNEILVVSGAVNFSKNDLVDDKVAIINGATNNTCTFFIGDFGVTGYKEAPNKLFTEVEMSNNDIDLITPGGKRNYQGIIPDGFPRKLGDTIRLIGNNTAGTVTLRTEDLDAPQTLFNGENSLEILIESSKEVSFTNLLEGGNVYQGTIPHEDVMSHNHSDLVNIDIYTIEELRENFGLVGSYNIDADVSITFMQDIVIDEVFNIANSVDFIIQARNHATIIEFTNTGTIFTHAGGGEFRITQGKFIFSGVGATILNVDVTNYYQSFATFTCVPQSSITVGLIKASSIILVKDSANTGFMDGLTVDTNFLTLTSALYQGRDNTTNTLLKINKVAQAGITDSILATGPGETMLDIRPNNRASIQLDGITKFSKVGNFFKIGDTGVITLFADASITAQAITSVTDSGGVARFNYTGATVYVNQEVDLSAFTETEYNKENVIISATAAGYFEIASIAYVSISAQAITSVTDSAGVARFNYTGDAVFIGQEVDLSAFTETEYNKENVIISATAAGYFEIASIAYVVDDTGSFVSYDFGSFDFNSMTVTSATHGLAEADSLLITDTMNYNAGHKIYNSLTDTFQVNAVFNTAETAGTWDTGSLTQESKYLNVIHAGDQKSSSTGTAIAVKDNTEVTAVSGTPAWNELNLGTAELGDLNSRFILIDVASGKRRYEGLFPVNLGGFVSISAEKSAVANVESYSFRMFKTLDTQSNPFDDIEMTTGINGDVVIASFAFSGTFYPGDEFLVQVRANGTASDDIIIVSYSDIIQ